LVTAVRQLLGNGLDHVDDVLALVALSVAKIH
jgi:hypothetical protein